MAAKLLLVEDDNNLREIYQARLQAEGYDIVSAKDGEEALVMAKKEQPDLIISDVMMPRVSGFEMLDILRNTEGMKDPKVIMLTALGQADDKTRADQLGADRYLVKSQVTLEDIVKAAQDLLSGAPDEATIPAEAFMSEIAPVAVAPEPSAAPASTPVTPAVTDAPVAAPPSNPVAPPASDDTPSPAADPAAVVPTEAPTAPETPETPAPDVTPEPAADPDPVPAPESEPTETPDPQPVSDAPVEPDEPVNDPTTPAAPVIDPPIEPDAVPAPTTPGTSPVVTEPVEDVVPSTNDQLMADALKDLTSATDTPEEEPSTEASTVTPPAPDVTPEPAADPDPVPAPESEPTETTSNDSAGGDSSPVAHKKVIRPLSHQPEEAPRPNINDLLAKEGMDKEGSVSSTPPIAPSVPAPEPVSAVHAPLDEHLVQPHPPGHVISPTPDTAPPSAPEPIPATPVDAPTAPETPEAPAPPTPPASSTPDNDVDPNSIAL